MEQEFYKGRLAENGLDVLVPSQADREIVHRVIYEELCLGMVNDESRREFLRIIDQLAESGAEAVIEGCTEIGLLVNDDHTDVGLYDTTRIHAERAVTLSLERRNEQ
jgi:aspartate racemase